MTVRLYDSRAHDVVDLTPLVEGHVSMYVCGPTVQSSPHIGHLRSALVYDIWRRWLTFRGYSVTLVRNVTDIDDKVLDLAAGTDEPWWARAYRVELEFTAGYRALGILPPTYEPRATASIPEMQDIIARLIARGRAYPAADDSGDVYFDTASWDAYGALTRQKREDMVEAADADPRGKRDARDFALWKGAKAGEPSTASWDSPWGAGRPGWHIECSAMSRRYLGPAFDIHGGGLDLRFPHHENELAQSTAAGDPFATYWLHNGLVTVAGQKMSKSLGNSIFAADFLSAAPPIVVRYFLGAAHYRSTIDHHDGSLAESAAALERITGFLARARRRLEAGAGAGAAGAGAGAGAGAAGAGAVPQAVTTVPDAFAAAMDDDLSVPQALAVLHETVRAGNAALDADDLSGLETAFRHVTAMVEVLGIDPTSDAWSTAAEDPSAAPLAALVERLVEERAEARANRDFATADRVRDDLAAAGITIEDAASGTHWSIA